MFKSSGFKAVAASSLFFVSIVISTMSYSNCGRAQMGLQTPPVDQSNGTRGIAVDLGSCPAGQVPIGVTASSALVCVPKQPSGQPVCPANSSLYEMTTQQAVCVTNTSWDQPGTLCPVGNYLVAYTSTGTVICRGPYATGTGQWPDLICPTGKYVSGVVNNQVVCTDLPATVPTAFVCPTGQYLADLRNGVQDCRPLPIAGIPNQNCSPDTQMLSRDANSQLLCQNVKFEPSQTLVCAAGKVLTGVSSTGTAICVDAPKLDLSHSCPNGLKAVGVEGGQVVCASYPSGQARLCPVGQHAVGVQAGQVQCAVVPVNQLPGFCPEASYPVGVSNGNLVCVGFPSRVAGEALVCTPGTDAVCAVMGGVGSRTCQSDGKSYGLCQAISCQAGYELANGNCRPTACLPGTVQSCGVMNGSGNQYCSAQGIWGDCQVTSCDAGYFSIGGKCLQATCTPGMSVTCSEGRAHGAKVCNQNGSGYGACVISSCDNGYTLRDGKCVDITPPRISFDIRPNVPTVGSSAKIGFAVIDNESGVRGYTCALDNVAFNPCVSPLSLTNLANGSHEFKITATDEDRNSATASIIWKNESCVVGTRLACDVSNGTGLKQCQADGTYGMCVANQCASGYEVKNGECVALMCGPGYSKVGNACVDDIVPTLTIDQAPANPNVGVPAVVRFTALDRGSGVAMVACKVDSQAPVACASPFEISSPSFGPHTVEIAVADNVGNKVVRSVEWTQYACLPGKEVTCGISNGSGTQVCLANGSGYGACTATACNEGFTVTGGLCLDTTAPTIQFTRAPQPTSPAASTTIEFSVRDQGSGVKSVQCALDLETPRDCMNSRTLPALSGGRHEFRVIAVDASGNTRTASHTWVVQACAPRSSVACSVANGQGQMTCEADGSGFGACVPTTCDAGYTRTGSSCVAIATRPIHRFFSTVTGEHFMTASKEEGFRYGAHYTYEGVGFHLYVDKADGMIPVYRCFSNFTRRHLVSTSENCEAAPGMVLEGTYGYAYRDSKPGTLPLVRWHAPRIPDHLATIQPNREYFRINGYYEEATMGYVPGIPSNVHQ